MSKAVRVSDLVAEGALLVEDGNHGEYRPRPNEFVEVGVPYIRAADMSSGVVNFQSAGKIDATARQRVRKGIGLPGDALLSHKGTVGKVGVAPMDSPDFVCSPQTTFWRSLDSSRIEQRYLPYLLKSSSFTAQLNYLMGQTDMAAYVSLTDQRAMTIPLPPIEVQRGIAEVLGALDDKIAANATLVTTADELAGHLTRVAMTGTTQALAGIAEITMGSSPPGTSYNESGEGVVFYQGVRDFGVRFPSNRVWTTQPVRQAQVDHTLVSVRAPVGRTNLASEQTCIGRGLASVRSVSGRPFSLFHIIRDSPDAWAPYEAEGTIFGSINKHQLAGLQVGVVDEAQSDRLEGELVALEARIAAAIHESAGLTEMRDALLPQLMSGKIWVKDAERVVEGVV